MTYEDELQFGKRWIHSAECSFSTVLYSTTVKNGGIQEFARPLDCQI